MTRDGECAAFAPFARADSQLSDETWRALSQPVVASAMQGLELPASARVGTTLASAGEPHASLLAGIELLISGLSPMVTNRWVAPYYAGDRRPFGPKSHGRRPGVSASLSVEGVDDRPASQVKFGVGVDVEALVHVGGFDVVEGSEERAQLIDSGCQLGYVLTLADILRAIVEIYEVESATGFDPKVVQAALRALGCEQPPYISKLERVMTGDNHLHRRTDGTCAPCGGRWPTAETIADRLVAALDEAAERESDPERKGWLRKTAAYLGNAGRDLAVEIGATAINRQMGT